jgi:phage terminase large subunit
VNEDLVAVFKRSYDDPEFFCEHVLRTANRGWQRRVLGEVRARLLAGEKRLRVLVRSCHGSGKTFLAAEIVLWWIATRPESRGLTTAPSWAVVENTLWPEIRRIYNGSLLRPLRFGRMLDTELKVRDAWYVVGAASDKPEKLEGHHSPTAAIRVVDEAKAVEQGVFDATEGMLDAPETFDLWITTPTIASGAFHDRDIAGGDNLIRIIVTVDDLIADHVPGKAEWKAERIEAWGAESPQYRSRCLAEYIDNADGALFPLSWVERAMVPRFTVDGSPTIGFDVAGSVDGDESVVAFAHGPDKDGRFEIRRTEGWQDADTMQSKGRVLKFVREEKPKKLRIDVIGIGKGVHDAIRLDTPVEAYRASDKPSDAETFLNRKAQDAWHVRDLLEKDLLQLPQSDVLRKQMAAMKFEINSSGRMKIVDPTDSPDHADAVIIALAEASGSAAQWEALMSIQAERKKAAA